MKAINPLPEFNPSPDVIKQSHMITGCKRQSRKNRGSKTSGFVFVMAVNHETKKYIINTCPYTRGKCRQWIYLVYNEAQG